MLTLNDGRSELWQWDTGRKLNVDADCTQVHFSNKVFGRSIDVDVVDGVAIIPDILLQTDKDLIAWSFVGIHENGYTKISKVFKVNKRNKPADYVFTPTDQTTLGEILDRIEDLEKRPSGDVSKEDIQDAVSDYLEKNPVSVVEKDPTVPSWAKQPDKPAYTADEVGALPKGTKIPSKTSELNNDSKYATSDEVAAGYQPKGNYLTEHQKLKTVNGQSLVGEGDITIEGGNPVSYGTVRTFSDAIMAWANGEKFPIAFIGDSTFYGTNTSGDGYTFCDKLQSLLREEFGSNATVYRVAKAGAKLDYGITNFDSWFGEYGTYADAEMVGIGFGINDRLLHTNYKSYFTDVYSKVEILVQKCFAVGKQPFIVTSQATIECGVRTDYTVDYPIRTAGAMDMCANNAKKEVAKKYNIPLIDYNDLSEKYLLYSAIGVDTIISDQLHFGDVGHAWAGGFFFSQINPRVIHIKGKNRQIVTYAHQSIESAVPQDKISYGGDYKLYTKYTKSDSSNLKIMDFYIFAEDTQCDICAYKNDTGLTYVSVDGVTTTLLSGETQLEQLEMGLHHIEVYTGESTEVDFIGFDINTVKSSDPALTRLATPIVLVSDTGLAEWDEIENASGYKYRVSGGTEQFTEATSVQLEFGQNIIVKAVGDRVTYQDSPYSGTADFGTTVEVDNLNLTPPKVFIAGIGPCVFAPGYNGTTKTTALSGATIKSFMIKSSNAGTLTVGVVDVNSYGNGTAPTMSKTKQVTLTAGDNTIDLSDIKIEANETLAIFGTNDTALPYYSTSIPLKNKNLFFLTSSAWSDGTIESIELQLIGKMTYIIP